MALEFDLACQAVLNRHDLKRDDSYRKLQAAAVWGVDGKDDTTKTKPLNGKKQTMTAEDIMGNYKK